MNKSELKRLFEETDYIHASGTAEERKAAEYLKGRCAELGVTAHIEEFRVAMADIDRAELLADEIPVPCKALMCCGSGTVEGELYYMPASDPFSIAGAKDRIVLLPGTKIDHFLYQDLVRVGAKGIICQYGSIYWDNNDIDERDLREAVRGSAKKLLGVTIHTRDAVRLLRDGVKHVRLTVQEHEYDGVSRNVVAELPGNTDDIIVLTAHFDSTRLSHGAYDNMSGCAALLGVMDAMKEKPHRCTLRFVFCGSEERGLLGSKAYVQTHKEDLDRIVLNINTDMIGSIMGGFVACVSAEEALAHYIRYMGAERGLPVRAYTGVYPSDSTPFADAGIPAVSFARDAGANAAQIHCRYDTAELLSMDRLADDIDFIAEFTRRMADSAVCPVSKEIPEDIRKQLDEYLYRKRKTN